MEMGISMGMWAFGGESTERRSATHVSGVPLLDGGGRADVRELRDLALRLPPVPGDQAVRAVRARQHREGPRSVIVAGVVGNCVAKRRPVSFGFLTKWSTPHLRGGDGQCTYQSPRRRRP